MLAEREKLQQILNEVIMQRVGLLQQRTVLDAKLADSTIRILDLNEGILANLQKEVDEAKQVVDGYLIYHVDSSV